MGPGESQETRVLPTSVERSASLVVLAFLVKKSMHGLRVAAEFRVGLFGLGVGDAFLELVLLEREKALVDGVDDPIARQLRRVRTGSRVQGDGERA